MACVQITAFCLISCVTMAMVEPLCSSFPTLRKVALQAGVQT